MADRATPATTLILLRHGETEWNREGRWQGQSRDTLLTELGREQARIVARRLMAFPIQAIYSSDLKRAWETAQIVGRALDLRPIVERALRESDVGTWTGLTWAEIHERWPEEVAAMFRGEDLRRGGGESYGEMRHRLSLAVDRIVAKHPGETILLVGHGAALRMLAVHTIGGDLTTMHRIAIGGNTALSIVRHQGGRLRLVSYNDTSHLDNGSFRVARAE